MSDENNYKDTFGILTKRHETFLDLFNTIPGRLSNINERVTIQPLVLEGVVIGVKTLYRTNSNPSLSVMVSFGVEGSGILSIDPEILEYSPELDAESMSVTINAFANHPDSNIITFVDFLVGMLKTEGFEFKSIPYTQIIRSMKEDIDIDSINGSLFPLITFEHPETKEIGFINCEPHITK